MCELEKYTLGIDIGSAYSKGILWDGKDILGSHECRSGGDFRSVAENVRKELFSMTGMEEGDISYTLATGYGSKQVAFANDTATDLSCHSKGVNFLLASMRTAVDVGDLYSKAFKMDGKGNLLNFIMSGNCAGGSARILKVVAKVLQLRVEEIGETSLKSKKRVEFSTGCAVFAESEAISRVAEGVAKEDLLAGIHRALGAQVFSLAERLGMEKDFTLTGGGARNIGLVKAMEGITGYKLTVPPEPHMTAALGAAIIGWEKK